MYCNLTRIQAFPIAIRFSSQTLPSCCPKPCLNPPLMYSTHRASSVEKSGFRIRTAVECCALVRARGLSSLNSERVGEDRVFTGAGKSLPWLDSGRVNGVKKSHKVSVAKTGSRSSWEESLDRLKENHSSSLEEADESFLRKKGALSMDTKESRYRKVDMIRDHRNGPDGRRGRKDETDEEKEAMTEEDEVVNDPRWDKIKGRFRGMVDTKFGSEKPEFRRWNKQENWGRKTWKEATESTLPKMVGEGVYGVGPVLAALSAGRREFYALYVQEGLDLSSNNRKKKDKKGFKKVFEMAQKLGLNVKDFSKHDLNMVVDNRPHQGLVLDASPLEMVKIKELDLLSDEEKGSLWVALDEVTDPQNLGAIIRSAYFFGASGVVLCAKNSAPLSGVVSKASAGSLELMELRYCKNMMQFLISSADNGWRVLGGSVSSKAVPLNEVLPGVPTILVLGSEGTGLRPLVERSCTQLVRIPGNIPTDIAAGEVDDTETTGIAAGEEFRSFLAVESLNVSVAAGVLLHHLTGSSHGIDSPINDKPTDMHQ
ncbi:subtilisin-like protease [Hibiscus syriacus]|uniref:rRNA methyltransferase 1, mitochondrial n=1 Tax=Hibiscus syriacus TaxID=106335 RepID=A0A6A2Z7Z4_HIBSY|nr:subtilisin-like protease [Hibiscus syriacus]